MLRRWGCSSIARLTVLCIAVLTLTLYSMMNKHIMHTMYRNLAPKEQEMRYKTQNENYSSDDPRDPRFYNIISEEDALMFEPCQNINESASIDYTEVTLQGRLNGTYNIGEEIQASVILHDWNGKRKVSGGDQLRATIEMADASAPCVVTDNRNGTHTIICEALWLGASTIIVTLAYTRETITSIYRIRTEVLATRNIFGTFNSRTFSEETICHPNNTHLLKLTNYTELCNMTYINSGMPFYCGKPKDVHLLCQDWTQVRTREPYPELPLTACEQTLLQRGQRILKQKLRVNVTGQVGNRTIPVIAKSSIPCSEYNVSLLWHSRKTTGLFYNGTWIMRQCVGHKENSFISCLKDRHLYLLGDSTMRAWYSAIIKRFQCQPITEQWLAEKWHKEAECYSDKNKFHAGWYPHSQPFYVGKERDDVRYTLYSVARRIDNIPQSTRAIVVIQIYMHIIAFRHNVFRQRMEIIRTSVEKFLSKSKHSIVMIKAPHTHEDTPAGGVRLSDYFGYVYSKILYEVFDGLHDTVVLLNNRDTTLAQHVKWNHPAEHIVNAMLDQMLNYACK